MFFHKLRSSAPRRLDGEALDGGKEPTYYEPQSGNEIEYYPDLYKFKGTDDWYPYVNSCIHLDCEDGIGYSNANGMWQCCDDITCP